MIPTRSISAIVLVILLSSVVNQDESWRSSLVPCRFVYCDSVYERITIDPDRVFYDGQPVALNEHYHDANTRFTNLGYMSGSADWQGLRIGGTVDSQIPVSMANDDNATIGWGYEVDFENQ